MKLAVVGSDVVNSLVVVNSEVVDMTSVVEPLVVEETDVSLLVSSVVDATVEVNAVVPVVTVLAPCIAVNASTTIKFTIDEGLDCKRF